MSREQPRFSLSFYSAMAEREYRQLSPSARSLVDIGLRKLEERADEIGKPLGGKLVGCKELKFRKDGLRIVFRIGEDGSARIVTIIAIGKRERQAVFATAEVRLAGRS